MTLTWTQAHVLTASGLEAKEEDLTFFYRRLFYSVIFVFLCVCVCVRENASQLINVHAAPSVCVHLHAEERERRSEGTWVSERGAESLIGTCCSSLYSSGNLYKKLD